MRAYFIVLAVFAGLLLLPSLSYCQQLNDAELKIYYEYVEKSEDLLADESLVTEEDAGKAFGKMESDLVKNNGISPEKLKDICDRAWENGITSREQKMLDEMNEKISAVAEPPSGSRSAEWEKWGNEREAICQKIADKNGIDLYVLYDIDKRAKHFAKKQMKK